MTSSIKELDFFAAKSQLKEFLRNQEQFKDYDFDGSNMSVLLDVLAYNTYQNAFYGNMLFSEMFLDSAQLRNSVISHAKELNYLPRSVKAAKAVVTVNANINQISDEYHIPAGTRFTANMAGKPIIFSTRTAHIARRASGTNRFEVKCIDIFQGSFFEETTRLVNAPSGVSITNENVDIDTVTVKVFIDGNWAEFTRRDTIYGVGSNDKVFYIEPSIDGKYNIQFGGGKYGYSPNPSQDVKLHYAVSDGVLGNGAKSFTTAAIPSAVVTTISYSSGGSDHETLEEIRFNAPKAFQHGQRAVTSEDYKNLILQRFSDVKSIAVFDGHRLIPPRHGKTAISLNMRGNLPPSESFKTEVLNFISAKTPVAIHPIFVNADFVYAKINAVVTFDPNRTNATVNDIRSEVIKRIMSANELAGFGYTLRQSIITRSLDGVNSAIIGSSISMQPILEFSPQLGISQTRVFDFATPLIKPYQLDTNRVTDDYKAAVKSTSFMYRGASAFIQDDGNGVLKIFSGNNVINQYAGSVDYDTGMVKMSSIIFDDYEGDSIRMTAQTYDTDISSPDSRILAIKESDISVTIKRI